jgi:hypothetical protein
MVLKPIVRMENVPNTAVGTVKAVSVDVLAP